MSTNINIIIINKSGKVIQQSVNDVENLETLYKKASFKSNENFEPQYVWNNLIIDKKEYESIVVFGKTVGNAGQENKYDFPPPIDNTLFFGNLLIIRYNAENRPMNLCIDDWKSIYNSLMGGFECLDDTDDDEESEDEEEVDKSKLDKYGYEKDGFVVEEGVDGEDEEDDDDDDDDSEEEDDDDMVFSDSDSDRTESDDEDDDEDEEEEEELDSKELKDEEYFTKID